MIRAVRRIFPLHKRTTILPVDFVARVGATCAASMAMQRKMNNNDTADGPGTILITDDHADTATALAILLRDAGFDVALASSVREALDTLDQNPRVHAVISDVRMPDVDGFDFLRVVKQRFPDIPVILMTGYPYSDNDVIPTGATILRKPLTMDQLEPLLRRRDR